jgi:hypothetical protein
MFKKEFSVAYFEIKRDIKKAFSLQPIFLWFYWSLLLSQVLQLFYVLYVGWSECGAALKLGLDCVASKDIIYWPIDIIRTYVILLQFWWVLLAFAILGIVRYFTQDKSFRKSKLTF